LVVPLFWGVRVGVPGGAAAAAADGESLEGSEVPEQARIRPAARAVTLEARRRERGICSPEGSVASCVRVIPYYPVPQPTMAAGTVNLLS
jgi:hypothetical protein